MLIAVSSATQADAWWVIAAGLVFLGWSAFAFRNDWNSTPTCIAVAVLGLAAFISGVVLAV